MVIAQGLNVLSGISSTCYSEWTKLYFDPEWNYDVFPSSCPSFQCMIEEIYSNSSALITDQNHLAASKVGVVKSTVIV